MRHSHPRGHPRRFNQFRGDNPYDWCVVCIEEGISTQAEYEYEGPNRYRVKAGMTVSWTQYMGQDGAGKDIWIAMTGQIWSQASNSTRNEVNNWWVVTDDQKVWCVRQDSLKIVSKGIADVSLL